MKFPKINKVWLEYAFCLIIGSIYLYSLTRTIFAATMIHMPTGVIASMGVASIIIFMVALYNRFTSIASLFVLGGMILYFIYIVSVSTYYSVHPRFEHFQLVLQMINGIIPFHPDLGRTVVWVVSLLLAVIVVVFMLHKFSFYMLGGVGIAIFMFSWGPSLNRDEGAFLLFLFAFFAMLIRKMNNSLTNAFRFAPLCAIIIVLVNIQLPNHSSLFVRRNVNDTVNNFMYDLGDLMFDLFNPTHFSFHTTGFSGAGGRLGGPVVLSDRAVMDVVAPAGIYLAGAISNIYTGFSWTQSLEDGDIYTHGLPPSQFEMLETAAALIRGATIASGRASITSRAFTHHVTVDDYGYLVMRDFPVIGMDTNQKYYLHTYLPVDTVDVMIGRSRTGTIFRPANAWGLEFTNPDIDYLHAVQALPSGDVQVPHFMSRETNYRHQFLNVNNSLTFIQYLLRQTYPGMYAAREDTPLLQNVTFEGRVVGVTAVVEGPSIPFDARMTIELPYPELNYRVVRREDISNHDRRSHVMASHRQEPGSMLYGYYWAVDHYDVIRRPDLTAQAVGNDSSLFLQQNEVFERIPMTTYSPLVTLAPMAGNVSPEVAHFMELTEFGVTEMQILVDLLLDSVNRTYYSSIGTIFRETYLMHWLDMFSTQVLAEYAYQVRQHFMDVPDIVTQRVHDLTHEIIANADTDFDRVLAIRNYLLQFPYTLTPSHVPRDVCFVDHFLFEGQEGYCTYFASAMAIMARIAGVPSRYVEGFATPRNDIGATSFVTITNSMAHAWVEVYLEGFGWVIIEATPAYVNEDDLPPPLSPEEDEQLYHADADRIDDQDIDVSGLVNRPTDDTPGTTSGTDLGAALTVDADRVSGAAPVLPIVILLGLLLYVFSKYWYVFHSAIKVSRLTSNKQVVAYFAGIIDIIEHFTTLGGNDRTLSDSIFFKDLTALYNKAKYSQHIVTEEERLQMEDAYDQMVGSLRQDRFSLRFVYLRYIRRVGVLETI